MTMVDRLLFRGEQKEEGLVDHDDVIARYPQLGPDHPLPKVSVGLAIMLVSTLVY